MGIKGYKDISGKQGFTLVELSIVLVIIGLIVAGITAGQSILHGARLRSVITEMRQYDSAFKTFELTYKAIPGDMTNAYDYWGSSCNLTASNCNGDGDGQIGWNGGTTNNESLRAWQHMGFAGLIPHLYTGYSSTSGQADPGINVPGSALDEEDTGYWFWYYTAGYEQWMIMGGFTAGAQLSDSALSPVDAYTIDKKIDDGARDTGKIKAANGVGETCISGGTYVLTTTSKACVLRYVLFKY